MAREKGFLNEGALTTGLAGVSGTSVRVSAESDEAASSAHSNRERSARHTTIQQT